MSRPTQSTKAQIRKQHLADFQRSQFTVAQFCHSIGCSITTFYHLKRKLAKRVILVQSSAITKLNERVDTLKKSLEEALGEIRFLRSGEKREKFINTDQMLLEFG